MYELLYISVSPKGFSESELKDLLECARIKNHKLNVTGMLVYSEREFIQILEGDEDVVKELFQTIAEDSRHMGVEIFYEGAIENRAFTGWSMAFKEVDGGDFGKLTDDQEEFSQQRTLINMIKDNPNRGKKTFLSLRDQL